MLPYFSLVTFLFITFHTQQIFSETMKVVVVTLETIVEKKKTNQVTWPRKCSGIDTSIYTGM